MTWLSSIPQRPTCPSGWSSFRSQVTASGSARTNAGWARVQSRTSTRSRGCTLAWVPWETLRCSFLWTLTMGTCRSPWPPRTEARRRSRPTRAFSVCPAPFRPGECPGLVPTCAGDPPLLPTLADRPGAPIRRHCDLPDRGRAHPAPAGRPLQSGKAGVSITPSTGHLFQHEVEYLGRVVRRGQLLMHNNDIMSLAQALPPRNQTELKGFLGMHNVYKGFVKR